MAKPIVIITGASGFLGSAVSVDLERDFRVIAMDRREPSSTLKKTAPGITWHILDISEIQSVQEVFSQVKSDFGQIDFVIHLAAYYDFGKEWVREYQSTNINGTDHVVKASEQVGVKRLIFASSVAAMEPVSDGSFLNEQSPTSEIIPYARSKSLGEKLIQERANQLPFTIIRIAGVFSDWCELPPLYGLIELWTSAFPFGRLIPGHGESGIPYIHLNDFVAFIRKCLNNDRELGPSNILLASQQGAILHRQLFPVIRSYPGSKSNVPPIYISKNFTKTALFFKRTLGKITGNIPYEHPWMIDYVDKSWATDTRITREILQWNCRPELGIINSIPRILTNLSKDPKGWELRKRARDERSSV